MYLDHAVEAVFHTKIQDIQLISFYLMWAVRGAAVFLMYKKMLTGWKSIYYKRQIFFYLKKASVKYYWHEKSSGYCRWVTRC